MLLRSLWMALGDAFVWWRFERRIDKRRRALRRLGGVK